MGEEDGAVIRVLETMLDAMVRRDAAALREVMADDMVLVHMTGLRQSREEFIAEVLDGTLRYRSCRMVDAQVQVTGRNATARVLTDTEAAVYGGGFRRWRLSMDSELRLEDGGWRMVRSVAGTYRAFYS